jgi:hypothetical protein
MLAIHRSGLNVSAATERRNEGHCRGQLTMRQDARMQKGQATSGPVSNICLCLRGRIR